MHVQVINFRLKGLAEPDYRRLCDDLAPAFAALPGLVSKVWLAGQDTGVFGGVYFWENLEAMRQFTQTDLFKAVATHPNLTDVVSRDFDVLEAPTRVTRGLISIEA